MIKRSVDKQVEKSLKRYPSLYYGPNARIMCLDHMLFGYGTGYKFIDDGSIVDVYDESDERWEKKQFARWEREKKEWLEELEKEKKDELYKEEWYRKTIDMRYERNKWYYDKFDPYADKHKSLRDGTHGSPDPVHKISRDYKSELSLINKMPDNVKKDILNAFAELLDYMISTNQDVNWAKRAKRRFILDKHF
jgi:hypothetical protein